MRVSLHKLNGMGLKVSLDKQEMYIWRVGSEVGNLGLLLCLLVVLQANQGNNCLWRWRQSVVRLLIVESTLDSYGQGTNIKVARSRST